MKLPTLYSRASTDAIQEWTIEIDQNRYRTIAGQLNSPNLTTSEWTVCKGKNLGKTNETTDSEQAEAEARAKWKKKKEKGCFEDIKDVDISLFTSPMLAKSYSDFKEDIKFPAFSQPKLDGIRCLISKEGMFSRNGKPIVAAPHIFNKLRPIFAANESLIFDGELFSLEFLEDFNQICSLVKKTKPTEEDIQESAQKLQYWIYDIVDPTQVFSVRFSRLTQIIRESNSIKLLKTDEVNSFNHIDRLYESYLNAKQEGQIIRMDEKYQNKRTKFLLKRKEFQDAEFVILGIYEGKGNKSGMAGYAEMVTKDGKIFNSNIKGDFEFLKTLLKNREKLAGKKATVQYFNLTPDEKVPRFPYIIKVNREDYE
jgi:DNA ligase-1